MNCSSFQDRLLKLEQPAQPPSDIQAHLASCPDCRQWQERLVRLEQIVRELPVPAALSRLEFLRRFLEGGPAELDGDRANAAAAGAGALVAVKLEAGTARRAPWLWRTFMAAAAAAGLSVAAIMILRGCMPPASDQNLVPGDPHPMIQRLLDGDLRLARGASPQARVEALADIADDLYVEAQTLAPAAQPSDLAHLASLFERVVREGVLLTAKELGPEGQIVLAPVKDRLARTAREADALALRSRPEIATALRRIADAAREVTKALP
jgi:hypothetical protein